MDIMKKQHNDRHPFTRRGELSGGLDSSVVKRGYRSIRQSRLAQGEVSTPKKSDSVVPVAKKNPIDDIAFDFTQDQNVVRDSDGVKDSARSQSAQQRAQYEERIMRVKESRAREQQLRYQEHVAQSMRRKKEQEEAVRIARQERARKQQAVLTHRREQEAMRAQQEQQQARVAAYHKAILEKKNEQEALEREREQRQREILEQERLYREKEELVMKQAYDEIQIRKQQLETQKSTQQFSLQEVDDLRADQKTFSPPVVHEDNEPLSVKSASFFEQRSQYIGHDTFDDTLTNDEGSLSEKFSLRRLFRERVVQPSFSWYHPTYRFAVVSLLSVVSFGSVLFVGHALAVKDRTINSAQGAVAMLQDAAASARGGDLRQAYKGVDEARDLFVQAQENISSINDIIVSLSRFVPGASKLASGDALISASVHLSDGLAEMTALSQELDFLQKTARRADLEDFSILDVTERIFSRSAALKSHLVLAQKYIATVQADDVPEAQRDQFLQLSRFIEPFNDVLGEMVSLEGAITELLGGKGPRKYLFLFQNNHEMRASGGFIGSYGFLDMNDGHIREFKIDGIYNPDGQLIDKVVPPRPIQKISAAWSMHDSNWWPHFPKSAEKAMDFYARSGGPSVDGVIAVTPVMVQKLLDLTGPLTLSEYNVTLTADNFVELTQYKVEKDYDKQENRPKKILSDLMPALMGELKKDLSREKSMKIVKIFLDGLSERHIMMYMRNDEIQDIIEREHWGGRLLDVEGDFLSVVHSNINGFKTDGVIDETIEHTAEFTSDGKVINTVTITREHGGGNTGREWWDAVNADYMRVYVPEGSRLLSAEGHTREWHEPRLDYEALKFENDSDVVREEGDVYVDPESGTRIYDDSGKTVFGNWVYVSPQEKVTVTYRYELPWRLVVESDERGEFSSYGILYQKQAGAQNVSIQSTLHVDDGMHIVSHVPSVEGSEDKDTVASSLYEDVFDSDIYRGIVFRMQR